MPQAKAVSSGGPWVSLPGGPRASVGSGLRESLPTAAGKSVVSGPVESVVGTPPFAVPGERQHVEQQSPVPAASRRPCRGCSGGTVAPSGLWPKPAPCCGSEAWALEMEGTLNQEKLWLKTSRGLRLHPVAQTPRLQLGAGFLPLRHCVAMCAKGVSHSAWKQERAHLAGSPGGARESGGALILTSGASSRKTSSSGREGSRAHTMWVSGTLSSQSVGLLRGPSEGHTTAASF